MKKYKLGELIDIFDFQRKPISGFERIHSKGIYPYYGANGIIDYVEKPIFKGEYILFAEDGTVCSADFRPIVFLTKENEEFWVNNHAHIFKAKQEICSNKYLFYNICTKNIKHIITGAVQLKINQENLKSLELSVHNSDEQQHIVNSINYEVKYAC